jgi:ATP-dependent 26S proteasome regulatory subunit
MALTPHGTDRLGELSTDPNAVPVVDLKVCGDIEKDVKKVVAGEKSKTSLLLYGAPGNGKTQFIKYLARKYSLPIYVVYLNPDYSNLDIATMFASIPRRSLVLMEDFDSYFNGRECTMKNDKVKFTFDAFINALDGVHNDYKQVIFAMTANDIKKVDSSLTTRPSRFKFVCEFGPPSDEVRKTILGDDNLVKVTKGMSLDAVFNYQTLSLPRHRRTKPRGSSGKATSKSNSQK